MAENYDEKAKATLKKATHRLQEKKKHILLKGIKKDSILEFVIKSMTFCFYVTFIQLFTINKIF